MKKETIFLLLLILISSTSCRSDICKETIKKLSLTAEGFCGICIGESVESVANKIGDVDPADYCGAFVENKAELSELREFNGVMANIIASYSDITASSYKTLAKEYNGNAFWLHDGGASTLILSIPCFQEGLLGRRTYLYDAICKYYRRKYSPEIDEQHIVSTFFKIRVLSNSYSPPNSIVVLEDKDNDMVHIIISNTEDVYSEWQMGLL